MNLSVAHLVGVFPLLYERAILEEIAATRGLGLRHSIIASSPSGELAAPEFQAFARDAEYLDIARSQGRWVSTFLNLVAGLISGLRARDLACTMKAGDVGRRARLRYILGIDRPDILHAQFGHLGLLAMPVAESMDLPLVVSCRGQDVTLLQRCAPRSRARLFAQAAVLLARSDFMRDELIRMGCPVGKVRVLRSGVNLTTLPFAPRVHPGRSERVTILAVGRLTPKKGLDDAIRALAQLPPGPVLRIVGDGPERVRLRALAAGLGVAANVSFTGALPRAAVVLEMLNAHLFLLPSKTAPDGDHEGIPNTLKEAQATGMPVIATRHAGIPECVEDGVSGLLAPEGDTAGIAAHMATLLADPARWEPMGRRGREIVEQRYDARLLATELVEQYHQLPGRRPDQPSSGQVAAPR